MRSPRPLFATLLSMLVLGACSGSSDGVTVSFVNASADLDEDGSALTIAVELSLPKDKDPLEDDVTVEVARTSGSATSGDDFVPFAATTLTFAAGANDGDRETVTLTSVEDGVLEGDETVTLSLRNPDGGKLGKTKTTTVTILDDEIPGNLVVTLDDGVDEDPITSGSTVAFGLRNSGAAAGDPVVLTLLNSGDSAVFFEAPLLSAGDAVDFSVLADPDLQTSGLPSLSAGWTGAVGLAEVDPELGWLVELEPDLLPRLAGEQHVRLEGVPLPEVGEVVLELQRLRSPWAADAKLLVDGEELPGGPAALLNDLSLWKGEVVGWPGSSLYLAFAEAGTRGWIQLDAHDARKLHVLSGNDPRRLRLAYGEQLAAHGYTEQSLGCGGARQVPESSPTDPAPSAFDPTSPVLDPSSPPVANKSIPATCRILFETDHQFFQVFGDETAATTYVTQLVGAVSDLYTEHVSVDMEIASLALYSTAGDPWTAPDGPTSISALLDEFTDERSPLDADIDLAHFISAAQYPDAAGLAFVGTLCNPNFGFSTTGYADGMFDAGDFDGTPAVVNFDFNTVAHELGHNFNSFHTDEYCPPLDRCVASCAGGAVCATGTIMSNCNICPGGELSIDPRFHPFIANEMRAAVNDSCLGTSRLNPGESIALSVNFTPIAESDTGPKSTTLRIEHEAENLTSPFTLTLTGTAN